MTEQFAGAVMTAWRSACGLRTVVVAVALLFRLLGSLVADDTEAMLVTVPMPVGLTTTWNEICCPGCMVPRLAVTIPPECMPGGCTDTNVVLPGSVLVT